MVRAHFSHFSAPIPKHISLNERPLLCRVHPERTRVSSKNPSTRPFATNPRCEHSSASSSFPTARSSTSPAAAARPSSSTNAGNLTALHRHHDGHHPAQHVEEELRTQKESRFRKSLRNRSRSIVLRDFQTASACQREFRPLWIDSGEALGRPYPHRSIVPPEATGKSRKKSAALHAASALTAELTRKRRLPLPPYRVLLGPP